MGCRILASDNASHHGSETGAILFCSTTGWAFGPVFSDYDEAEEFLQWFRDGCAARVAAELGFGPKAGLGFDGTDPRDWQEYHLETLHRIWVQLRDAVRETTRLRVVS